MSDVQTSELPFQFYRSALDALPAPLLVLNQAGLIVAVNRAWTEAGTEYALSFPQGVIGRRYLDICGGDPNLRGQAGQGIQQVLAGQLREFRQVYACHTAQRERWFQLRVTPFADAPYLLVVHEDITLLKQAEEDVRQQYDFAQSLVDSSPNCIELLSLNHELLWMNRGGQSLLELSEFSTLRGMDWLGLWSVEDQVLAREALATAGAGGRGHFQGERDTAGGQRKFWDMAVMPVRDAAGQPIQLMVSSRDLTTLRAAQRQASEMNAQVIRVLSSIREAFVSLDSEWRFVFLNRQAERMLGRQASELLSQNLWDLFPEALDSQAAAEMRRAASEQRSSILEYFSAQFGRWLEMRLFPYAGGLAVYFQDIDPRKREEQAQHERNTILEMTVKGRALAEVLEQVTAMTERQWPGYVCTILLNEGGRLYTRSAPSLPPSFQRAVDGLEMREGAGVCGTAASRQELVVVEDVTRDPNCTDFLDLLLTNELWACASHPIIDGSAMVLGTLAIYARQPGPFPDELLADLKKAGHLAAVAIEHHQLTRRLILQATHDSLTGLANRSLFIEQLQSALATSRLGGLPVALLFIDLDDFKGLNDSLGHSVGDQMLREFAVRLQSCVRQGDLLARISGDEFTVILPGTGNEHAVQIAQRCLKALELPFIAEEQEREVYLTASIGISVTPEGGHDAETLRRSADLAMYHAKSRKSGWAMFEPSLNRHSYQRFQLAAYLRRAAEKNELEVHYQPQVRLKDQVVVGLEALLRWKHPHLGLVPPAQFIPVAEETGLIVSIGAWVLREVCRQGAQWLSQGRAPVRLAVNVSALQFEREDFVGMVERCLNETGFPGQSLELELTERLVMRDVEASVRRMQQLGTLGVSISIDDFGTGFSSLSYLSRLPISVLKVDRSFVFGLQPNSVNYPVVKAILGLAESLQLVAVAEGIETPEELKVLKALGCGLGQGYLFARPRPADENFWASIDAQVVQG
ncbi:hypothetical protein GCM10022631_20930 [Deinococcus rubellus]|uniref:EAL domain-containing protein n=1 Tax=Deinococcus rubellus TaxID=1889240 RepID=A0ABY5YII3_9DEIO|nr:EAL domain-containing protein [Deinococcus rubellus]UWX64486.1 EAL domain-containing protein [Deinococcus rubellus]